MSVTFLDTAPMQGGTNIESVEKVVYFAKNANVCLCLGVDAALKQGLFLLILLFISQIHYKLKDWAHQLLSYIIS